ncbi:MAG: hypothetical protein JJ896_14250 [Rhodothermales bacterium]|nr:hypothetical protein [Rhodothermales bacterium]MBO6780811.1 hypothetical protein [Rhodothermales bacterium]
MTAVWVILGALLGAGFFRVAASRPEERDRWLALGLFVAAQVYVIFGFMAGQDLWLLIELLGVPVFAAFAWFGLMRDLRILAVGWMLHTLWDAGLHLAGGGALVAPRWYVLACLGFDLAVGVAIWRAWRDG